jgi:hypothetical protein
VWYAETAIWKVLKHRLKKEVSWLQNINKQEGKHFAELNVYAGFTMSDLKC